MKKLVKNGLICGFATLCAASMVAMSACSSENESLGEYMAIHTEDFNDTSYSYRYILVNGELHTGDAEYVYVVGTRYTRSFMGYHLELDCGREYFATDVTFCDDVPLEYTPCEDCLPTLGK